MTPRSFEYHSPTSVEEALELMRSYGDEAKVLAGGQSLIPLMKLRIVSPPHIIDIGRVKGMSYIRKEGAVVAIGAMTRMAEVEASALLAKSIPILTDCAAVIADPLVRNMGTIGGNVSHGDPTNDMPAVLVATRASIIAEGQNGRRTVPATEFFLDTFATALEPNELLVEVRLPLSPRTGNAYVKLERQAGDFAIVAAGANLKLSADGSCEECGIALTAVGPTVIRAVEAERSLRGKKPNATSIGEAASLAADATQPVGDLRGSAEYKKRMAAVVTERALGAALKRARGASK